MTSSLLGQLTYLLLRLLRLLRLLNNHRSTSGSASSSRGACSIDPYRIDYIGKINQNNLDIQPEQTLTEIYTRNTLNAVAQILPTYISTQICVFSVIEFFGVEYF